MKGVKKEEKKNQFLEINIRKNVLNGYLYKINMITYSFGSEHAQLSFYVLPKTKTHLVSCQMSTIALALYTSVEC